MDAGTKPTTYLELHDSSRRVVAGEIVAEAPLSVHINGQEWVSLMCTPVGLEDLVLGFLLSEGVIESPADVRMMEVAHRGQVADVWLRKPHVQLPDRRTVTSGCGGGVTFADLAASREAIQSGRCISVRQVFDLMDELNHAAVLYRRSQGIHTSALSDADRLLAVAEDVGRHNTLDKLRGRAARQGISTDDTILITTGRISSEMLRKGADMGVPIIISRTSPTSLSLELARAWGISLLGYVRGRRLRIYVGHERVIEDDAC